MTPFLNNDRGLAMRVVFPITLILAFCLGSCRHAEPSTPEGKLARARAAFKAAPHDPDALIWFGRRTAYLGRYDEAITIYSQGIAEHPDDPRLWRHRGHRHISTRAFDKAVADLTRAAELIQGRPDEIEPDGLPNRLDRPTGTLRFNIYYHLGLAHYLMDNNDAAMAAYRECLKAATFSSDALVACLDWMWMTAVRQGDRDGADRLLELVHPETYIIENRAYLARLLMRKGLASPETLMPADADDLDLATYGYGIANWYETQGDTKRARKLLERVVAGPNKTAFGYIAAEADLARRR